MGVWEVRATRAAERHDDALARLPEGADERQRQLTRAGNAAWAAGLSLLMAGRGDEGRGWLVRSAERYRESWVDAPSASWGRPIGAMKSRLIAGDDEGARSDARWALEAGALEAEGPVARYAAVLAHLVLGEDSSAASEAAMLLGPYDFPAAVGAALTALAAGDGDGYERAVRALLADFEGRTDFLEDVPVADTVLALQALAAERGWAVELESSVLPP